MNPKRCFLLLVLVLLLELVLVFPLLLVVLMMLFLVLLISSASAQSGKVTLGGKTTSVIASHICSTTPTTITSKATSSNGQFSWYVFPNVDCSGPTYIVAPSHLLVLQISSTDQTSYSDVCILVKNENVIYPNTISYDVDFTCGIVQPAVTSAVTIIIVCVVLGVMLGICCGVAFCIRDRIRQCCGPAERTQRYQPQRDITVNVNLPAETEMHAV